MVQNFQQIKWISIRCGILDESSSSSSSSSEDSDDFDDGEGSIDSRDFGFIKQDLNVCPKGCEPALFNFTIDLRSKR